MVNRNDANGDALLQQVIEQLRRQEIPDFPDPEIAGRKGTRKNALLDDVISLSWRMTVNRRFQLCAGAIVGLAVILGFMLIWNGNVVQPVSAMEQMAESIRKAKSYKYRRIEERTLVQTPGEPEIIQVEIGYWLAPGAKRIEVETVPDVNRKGRRELVIMPLGRPGISVDHETKTFVRGAVALDVEHPLSMPDFELIWEFKNLGRFAGKPDRELGVEQISGRRAYGFEIDSKTLDPELTPGLFLFNRGPIEIWLDADSHLPLRVRNVGERRTWTTEIDWNIDLDPLLFEPKPPMGYSDVTPISPESDGEIRSIIQAFERYRFASGGRYPLSDSDMAPSELHKVMTEQSPRGEAARAQPRGPSGQGHLSDADREKRWKARNAINSYYWPIPGNYGAPFGGFERIAVIRAFNPGYAYHGKTVGPKDRDKVLLRWKLDDGRYEVIFGDLHNEAVTAENLRLLEGK